MPARVPLPPSLAGRPFSTREALAAGVGRGRLGSSDIRHPFRGVNLPSAIEQNLRARCLALQSRLPSYAYFCGTTAASLMSIPLPSRWERSPVVHVAVPAPHTAPRGHLIVGHRFDPRDAESRDRDGVRVSTPARAWRELSPGLPVDDLVAAGDFLIHWERPLTTVHELRETLALSRSRRGIRALDAALPLLHDRSESAQESKLRLILIRGRVPGLAVNLPIMTSGGYKYRADIAMPAKRVIVEYQSLLHMTPERYRADMTRRSRLEADGWFVIEVNAQDLADPGELVSRVTRVLAGRAPWPDEL